VRGSPAAAKWSPSKCCARGLRRAFQKDIDAFYLIARLVEMLSPGSRRLRPMDVITHFEGVVLGELDLRLEASAAGEFRGQHRQR